MTSIRRTRGGALSSTAGPPPNVLASPRSRRPVRSASLADRIYALLKRRIVRSELLPGMRITEGAVAREFGTGKTPVREALKHLVRDGLARSIPRHGYETAAITLRDVRELFAVRVMLEPNAVEMAVGQADVSQLRRLDALFRRRGDARNDHDILEYQFLANRELHLALIRSCGNGRLTSILGHLLDESERLYHLSHILRPAHQRPKHDHEELIAAVSSGDVKRARSVVVEHIRQAERNVIEALLASPQLLSAEVTPSIRTLRGVRPLDVSKMRIQAGRLDRSPSRRHRPAPRV